MWKNPKMNSIIVKSSYIEPDFSIVEYREEADLYKIEY